jgi:hypothetical protein
LSEAVREQNPAKEKSNCKELAAGLFHDPLASALTMQNASLCSVFVFYTLAHKFIICSLGIKNKTPFFERGHFAL